MKNYRTWGKKPYKVAVVHGGPGIAGHVAPVAKELSRAIGVLEPLQTKNTFEAQVEELADVLKKQANIPVILIGHSWGAFLSFVITSRYTGLVKKLIMVGAGPFEEKYAANIEPDRLDRLSEKDRAEAIKMIDAINDPALKDKDTLMGKVAALFDKADTYAPLLNDNKYLTFSEEINRKVWVEAKKLRTSGEVLELGKKIVCPVVAIHGDYDPHLPEGVREPLIRVLKNFKFILLEKCGHEPWQEKFARDKFFKILKKEIV
jgi:pimeloyl-ACP methyl ester carboxylesterase